MQRQRRTAAASKGQTRAYAERLADLVPVLRSELARLAERRRERRADDHSDADETIYRKMGTFEPPEGGHVELTNGPDLDAGIERVAKEVERCAFAS